MRECYILRGLPGSGKTTWAKKKREEAESVRLQVLTVTSDAWVPDAEQGKLIWSKDREAEAERKCLQDFCFALTEPSQPDIIIVNKFNTWKHEFVSYLQIAEAFGYDLRIVELMPPYDVCLKRMGRKRMYRSDFRYRYETWHTAPSVYSSLVTRIED